MVSQQQILEGVKLVAEKMKENREFLTDLDAKIGDGDHGINMDRGFTAVLVKLETMPDADIGAMLKAVGMALLSTVGGASGPLYGTAYMRVGAALAGKAEITAEDALQALKAAQEGIQTRGKAVEGEKTMLDALIPAIRALEKGLEDGLSGAAWWAKGIEAAEAGIEYTKTIIATKGRASYLGERSLGFQDPGATSLTLMLKCFAPA
jgi:dihydroxyacetone kinase-like protein